MCIPKNGSLLRVDREIFNIEFFFHKQYGIIPTPNSCCFKVSEVIKQEPKQMEYFIFSAPEYIC